MRQKGVARARGGEARPEEETLPTPNVLKKNSEKADAEIQRLKADKAEDDDDGPDDEEMDDELKTKEDWERVIAEAEADSKHAEGMLKK